MDYQKNDPHADVEGHEEGGYRDAGGSLHDERV
jgi:hypothetical protein